MHSEDPEYKETLFATFRAARAIDAYLMSKEPTFEALPASRRPAELERLRKQHQTDSGYIKLLAVQADAQNRLEAMYPRLFVPDESINRQKKERRKALNCDPAFRKVIDETAEPWRARQEYMYTHGEKLGDLQKRLQSVKK